MDNSFSDSPKLLVRQMTEEVLDIAGWGLILYAKLKRIEAGLRKAEELVMEGTPRHGEDPDDRLTASEILQQRAGRRKP